MPRSCTVAVGCYVLPLGVLFAYTCPVSPASATKATVLIIEDEAQIRRLLRLCLERDGYQVVEAATGDEGIGEAVRCRPEAVLLDLGLPDMDGLSVLKRLREWTQAPILVVSVRGHEDDKITALDNGANDYITKPFSTGELLARLRVSRRTAQAPAVNTSFSSGPLKVDLATRTVKVKGRQVRLTAQEYALLVLFVQHAGKVLTHGFLLRQIWGSDAQENIGHLRVYMKYLRQKIELNPADPELLITEPGVGYRLTVRD
ncbi:MAG: DNA-binding response regulator [Verrucomicrobia bacterium]|nr:MAG: DNA-binding response regulator [Verrucomicrobiota bacterium]